LKLASNNEDHVTNSISYLDINLIFGSSLKPFLQKPTKQYTFISRAKCAKKSPIFITCNLIYQRCTAHTIKIHFWNSLLRPKRNDSWTSDSLMLSSFQWTFTSHFNDFYFSIFHFFIFFENGIHFFNERRNFFSVYDLRAWSSLTSSIIKDEIGNEFAEKKCYYFVHNWMCTGASCMLHELFTAFFLENDN